MADETAAEKAKKERSPSFPFIPLGKAIERAKALLDNHRREPARLAAVAATWGYGVKSSGLLQTVAALKQFGLIEDLGSGEERKIQISDLGRRILMDQRPGAREAALKEAAVKPRLIAEYLPRWVPDRPSDAHCISELHLDRGFNTEAAKLFLRVFDQTVDYANLREADSLSSDLTETGEEGVRTSEATLTPEKPGMGAIAALGPKPIAQRLKLEITAETMGVTAVLRNKTEVDTLIRMLEANKALLPEIAAETGNG